MILAVVVVVTGFIWAARMRASAGTGSGGKSISPHPSFSSSSLSCANPLSCASPHPSVDVGDAGAASSVWRNEFESGAIGRGADTSTAEAAQGDGQSTLAKQFENLFGSGWQVYPKAVSHVIQFCH